MNRKLSPEHLEKMRRGRELAAKKRGATTHKKVAKKPPVKRVAVVKKKTVSRETNSYVVKVETVKGTGYLSGWTQDGPTFDTEMPKALSKTQHDAKLFALAVYTSLARGLKSVEVVKK